MTNNQPFTSVDRQLIIGKLIETSFDLVIIGGGITGAGVALDAASRGLKVALLEKADFASGTSSKSTKLIHGGLRYLKQFDFWLVKEVGSERAIVHQLAPHLVLPEKMLLPLIENGSYGKWLTSIGLKVYDILAEVDEDDKRRMLDKKEALAREPLLPRKKLKGAGYYAEYRTDDARLTIEIIKTGIGYGATALNYVEVTDFLYESGMVAGVKAKDKVSGKTFSVNASYVINAAGPWVDELRALNNSRKGKRLHLTKGVHLVFPHEKLPVRQSVYFDVPDGRMIFAIPRGRTTYVGTTDTNYNQDKDKVTTNLADAIYLISAVNNMFPDVSLEIGDIISSWAGIRPLIHEEGKSASELSRKDEIFTSVTGLISIAGGKLTGYRKMAERVVNRIAAKMEESQNRTLGPCNTVNIPLCGNAFRNYKKVKKYIREIEDRTLDKGLSRHDAWYLATTYGIQTEEILRIFDELNIENPEARLISAELEFVFRYEMIETPLDFFIRRTGRMYFEIDTVRTHMDTVLNRLRELAGADEPKILAWRALIESSLAEHSDFSSQRA